MQCARSANRGFYLFFFFQLFLFYVATDWRWRHRIAKMATDQIFAHIEHLQKAHTHIYITQRTHKYNTTHTIQHNTAQHNTIQHNAHAHASSFKTNIILLSSCVTALFIWKNHCLRYYFDISMFCRSFKKRSYFVILILLFFLCFNLFWKKILLCYPYVFVLFKLFPKDENIEYRYICKDNR